MKTKGKQRLAKKAVDEKLQLSVPSRELLEKLAVDCASKPSPENTFQYAFALSKSDNEAELKYACTILDGLVKEGYEHQIDCMFGSATALYALGDFDNARVSEVVSSYLIFDLIISSRVSICVVY